MREGVTSTTELAGSSYLGRRGPASSTQGGPTTKEHILLETLAWQEHEATGRRRAILDEVADPWRQLERFIDLYLPADAADPSSCSGACRRRRSAFRYLPATSRSASARCSTGWRLFT